MAWRAAESLLQLFDQLDALAPHRSKDSDGTKGDQFHEPPSDHIPDAGEVVRAGDYTHDPAHGADMGRISEALRISKDRRIKYVIFNRRTYSATVQPWTWRDYTEENPHTGHMHVSVVRGAIADDRTPWQIGDDMTPEQAARLRNIERVATNADLTTWQLARNVETIEGAKAPDGSSTPYPNMLGRLVRETFARQAELRAMVDLIAAKVDLDPAELLVVAEAARLGAFEGAHEAADVAVADALRRAAELVDPGGQPG